MIDIVGRLRAINTDVTHEAADEIERLRADMRELEDFTNTIATLALDQAREMRLWGIPLPPTRASNVTEF